MGLTSPPRHSILPFPGGEFSCAVRWPAIRAAIAQSKRRFRPALTIEDTTAILDWIFWAPVLHDANRFRLETDAIADVLALKASDVARTVDRLVRIGMLDAHDSTVVASDYRGDHCPARDLIDGTAVVELLVHESRIPRKSRASLLATMRAVLVTGNLRTVSALPTLDVSWHALGEERALTRMSILPHLAQLERAGAIVRDVTRKSPPAPMRFELARSLTRRLSAHENADAPDAPPSEPAASVSPRASALGTAGGSYTFPDGASVQWPPHWSPAEAAAFIRSLRA